MENKERNMAVAGPDAEELDREAILKWMEFFNNKFEDEPSEKKGKVNERDH